VRGQVSRLGEETGQEVRREETGQEGGEETGEEVRREETGEGTGEQCTCGFCLASSSILCQISSLSFSLYFSLQETEKHLMN